MNQTDDGVQTPPAAETNAPTPNPADINSSPQAEIVTFSVGKDTLTGTLLRAVHDGLKSASGYPAVVMGHGLSMTRDSSLHKYAERFAQAGIHAYFFDYRCFGDSTGTPRELVSAKQQVQDYHGALHRVRRMTDVDAQRVAIWGTSYSGGIAMQAAHEDRQHRGLVMQVPNLDNAATGWFLAQQNLRKSPIRGLWIAALALIDSIAGFLHLPAVYIKAIGKNGEWAAYTSDVSYEHTNKIKGPAWQNRIALRDFARLPIFRPIRHAKTLPGPMLIITADQDDLTPVWPALRAAELAGDRVELHRYDVTHFEIYNGTLFEDIVAKEIRFLTDALRLSA